MFRPAIQWFLLLTAGLFSSFSFAASTGIGANQTGAATVTLSLLDQVIGNSQAGRTPLLDMIVDAETDAQGRSTVRGVVDGPGPGSRRVPVEAASKVTARNLGKTVLRGLPILGTAITISELLEDLRAIEGPGGTVLMDGGQGPDLVTQVCTTATTGGFASSSSPRCARNTLELAEEFAGFLNETNHGDSPTPTVWGYSLVAGTTYRLTYRRCPGGSCGAIFNSITISTTSSQVTGCPEGQSVAFWDINRCTTSPESWAPTVEPLFLDRFEQYGNRAKFPAAVAEAIANGVPVDLDLPSVTGPSSVQGERVTTTNPDGTVTVRDTDHPLVYGPGPKYTWRDRVTERTYPPGATIPDPGEAPGEGSTPGPIVEGPGGGSGGSPAPEIITCGLPDTPACKIDESGTPSAPPPDVFGDPDASLDPLRTIIDQQPLEVEWTWAFTLPTGCEPFQVPGFEDIFPPLDMCQWQPMIHDLMSLIWIATGIWGSLSLVSRTLSGVN